MSASLQLSLQLGILRNDGRTKILRQNNSKTIGHYCLYRSNPPSISLKEYHWSFSKRICRRTSTSSCTNHQFRCCCFVNPGPSLDPKFVKYATSSIARSFDPIRRSPVIVKLASALGIFIFAIWGLRPIVQLCRNIFLQKNDANWKKSNTYLVTTSYVQPLLLWMGAIIICRSLDPMTLPTEAGQIVKQRLLTFVRSLSTVLAFAYCLSSIIQQLQKYLMETRDSTDTRSMGFQFASKAVYTAVWVAAVSLFMELLGFSTQRWLTAGGLGTVLLTLAGREIFTNFLSSAIIHATRPFVVNEWIQTKIEGYEVSGTVERVGWWSPTIIRGEDREAVHIPNHKFTMNVVRNLTQKNHWRIKTHIAISHFDVRKINIIVADMRKVLSKNPQVEHKKLHRRVFLDNINPENQALMILVSCFVKTSHMEEYLCVKEAILLDLLRVVRHHRARLATPIRTVHKAFPDADLDNVPFSESMYDQGEVLNRPMLLIEPSSKINGEDKLKSQSRSTRVAGERDLTTDPKSKVTSSTEHMTKEMQTADAKAEFEFEQTPKIEKKDDPLVAAKASGSTHNSSNSSKQSQKAGEGTTSNSGSLHDSGARRSESHPKHEGRQTAPQMPTSKSTLEENIVLGVALEGSKRTLPIEEEIESPLNPEETKELATLRSGNSNGIEKEKSDTKKPNSSGYQGIDQ